MILPVDQSILNSYAEVKSVVELYSKILLSYDTEILLRVVGNIDNAWVDVWPSYTSNALVNTKGAPDEFFV